MGISTIGYKYLSIITIKVMNSLLRDANSDVIMRLSLDSWSVIYYLFIY